MTTCAIRSLTYGIKETTTSLIKKAPVILAGTVLAAGVGYLTAGSAAAYLAAKISYCLLSVWYSLGYPDVVTEIRTPSETAFRFVGNITPLAILTLLLFNRA
jgi:hypothetical protein